MEPSFETEAVSSLRPALARDGIFNLRDLGGLETADGRRVVAGRVLRADALHRLNGSLGALRTYGVTRVIDLRDQRERDDAGALDADGIRTEHHPVLDPTFDWHDEQHAGADTLLAQRYQVILREFGSRLAAAVLSLVEELDDGGAVAYHCAVGKDRTGLLTMLLLDAIGVNDDQIVADYARSAAATAVQVSWLWSFGLPGGDATDLDLGSGVWSARPETMARTIDWMRAEYGGANAYLEQAGVSAASRDALRSHLLVDG